MVANFSLIQRSVFLFVLAMLGFRRFSKNKKEEDELSSPNSHSLHMTNPRKIGKCDTFL